MIGLILAMISARRFDFSFVEFSSFLRSSRLSCLLGLVWGFLSPSVFLRFCGLPGPLSPSLSFLGFPGPSLSVFGFVGSEPFGFVGSVSFGLVGSVSFGFAGSVSLGGVGVLSSGFGWGVESFSFFGPAGVASFGLGVVSVSGFGFGFGFG